jgi:hypothetical protein
MIGTPLPRHAGSRRVAVSASILPRNQSVQAAPWTLKRVQGDGVGDACAAKIRPGTSATWWFAGAKPPCKLGTALAVEGPVEPGLNFPEVNIAQPGPSVASRHLPVPGRI